MKRLMLNSTFIVFLVLVCSAASAKSTTSIQSVIELQRPISFDHYPVVITGDEVPHLKGLAASHIGLLAVHNGELQPVVFQIDAKGEDGRFILEGEGFAPHAVLDGNDEVVFLAKDAGDELNDPGITVAASILTGIELADPDSGARRWVYAVAYDEQDIRQSPADLVHYDRDDDTIRSDTYRIRFAKETPFLVDTFNWADPSGEGWLPDLIDRMKVRHTGKLFGMYPFVRTHGDYKSELVAVKDGPVRVIRRTANRVRILWYLRTPELLIDYVAYPNVVYMDTHIDLPFRLGMVLKDIETFTTVDWDDNPGLPQSRFYTESLTDGLLIDGVMDAADEQFNQSGDNWLVIDNDYGSVLTGLVFDKKLPVNQRVYLMDDRTYLDPPEDVPGQFGNIGYVSDRWEQVGTGLQHMLFAFYMVRDISPSDGIRILQNAPWYLGD
jgi:hypothetical protein